jgi:hypothetical protein
MPHSHIENPPSSCSSPPLPSVNRPGASILQQHPGDGRAFTALAPHLLMVAAPRDSYAYDFAQAGQRQATNAGVAVLSEGSLKSITPEQYMEVGCGEGARELPWTAGPLCAVSRVVIKKY